MVADTDDFSFILCFGVVAVITYICRAALSDKGDNKVTYSDDFKKFQRAYLTVYLIMMGADWLQGPYVYELYVHYNFSSQQIGQLFVVGFGTSMVSGSFVGSLADKYGRKKMCLAYAVMYTICCWTKHSSNIQVLMVGRFFGGISTSILFSAFESWLVSEHHSRGYSDDWLAATFSTATSLNGFVAIAAGIVGNFLVNIIGFVAPFDLSWILLLAGGAFIMLNWPENYGDQTSAISTTLRSAFARLVHDPRIPLIGCIQSFFEGAMYIFVLMWTPALSKAAAASGIASVAHGWVFASFMTAVMFGSTIFSYLMRQGYKVERFSIGLFFVAAASLLVPVLTMSLWFRMAAFLVFEACVGMFWPCLGTMRSCYVPEEVRATLMNFFRIPLNIIVVVVLYQDRDERVVFWVCAGLLVMAGLCQYELKNLTVDAGDRESRDTGEAGAAGAEQHSLLERKDEEAEVVIEAGV